MLPSTGIIPYGSTDPSVILQSALTSLAEIQSKGGVEVSAGNNSYDSTLGMKANTTNAGIQFDSIAGGPDLNFAGQISFEIETAGLCAINSALPSSGTDWAGNTHFIVLRPLAATTNYFRAYMDANERMGILFNVAGSTAGTNNPGASGYEQTSHGKGRFSRLTFSWVGSRYSVYIDGYYFWEGSRGGYATANIGERIALMAGAGLGTGMSGIYCRNLTVSTKPVYMSNAPGAELLGIVSHSFGTRARMTYTDFYRDRAWGPMVEGELLKLGLGAYIPKDSSTIWATSGATILRSGGSPIKPNVDLFKASDCTVGIYIGGTNDAINASWAANRAQTLADIKLDLADMFTGRKCKRVIFCNVPSTFGNSSNYAASNQDANIQQINSDFDTLVSWWEANNPTKKGALIKVDLFNLFGGLTPNSEYFVGTKLGTYTDLHPSAAGHIPMAKAIAAAIAATLMRPQP